MTDPVDIVILRHLFAPGRPFVSDAALAEELGCSRTAIWKRIEGLERLGYGIEARPQLGYRLMETPDIVVGDEIRARLPRNPFAEGLVVFRETRSTNDIVWREAENGAAHGFAALAEAQTLGRGRLGRRWVSATSLGLWVSLLLRVGEGVGGRTPQSLTMLAAVAVVRALDRHLSRSVTIKWPNDVLLGGRKVCGILVEARMDADGLQHGILGIGLNVNHDEGDFPEELRVQATSMFLEDRRKRRRADVLVSIFDELERLTKAAGAEWMEEWRARCETIGAPIRVQTLSGVREGQMVGVTGEGHLLLRGESGVVETLATGSLL
ncbi:MAG: biotin--[acetyl-CoA-carboxylase] ligase [Candidatus Methylacidiphilales bacterium]